MTQIDEPIFKQVDDILNELINVACNYEKGKDVDLDAKTNETNHALQALIATQIQEARIDELNRVPRISYSAEFAIHIEAYLDSRIAQLRSTK